MQIIDGKKIAEEIVKNVRMDIKKMQRKPQLAMFLVGDDDSSKIYISKKEELCKKTGIKSKKIILTQNITQEELIFEIEKQNIDNEVDAMLVQLPLPGHIDQNKALKGILPQKDVDCLHPENFGEFCAYGSKESRVSPITAMAVERILSSVDFNATGKLAVVVGCSNIAGKPAAIILSEKGSTVTTCHDKTVNLSSYTRKADVLVVAVGEKHLITKEMIKEEAFVIDVGINRENGRIYGDVDFEEAKKVASYLTPVPGGVGPVTVAVLMENTLRLAMDNI